ncbi:unnamed protein product, partial [marine sediment metagenome]
DYRRVPEGIAEDVEPTEAVREETVKPFQPEPTVRVSPGSKVFPEGIPKLLGDNYEDMPYTKLAGAARKIKNAIKKHPKYTEQLNEVLEKVRAESKKAYPIQQELIKTNDEIRKHPMYEEGIARSEAILDHFRGTYYFSKDDWGEARDFMEGKPHL